MLTSYLSDYDGGLGTFRVVDSYKHEAFMHFYSVTRSDAEKSLALTGQLEMNKHSANREDAPKSSELTMQVNFGSGGREVINCRNISQIPDLGCRSCQTKPSKYSRKTHLKG